MNFMFIGTFSVLIFYAFAIDNDQECKEDLIILQKKVLESERDISNSKIEALESEKKTLEERVKELENEKATSLKEIEERKKKEPCEVGWVYFNASKSCYYLQNMTDENGIPMRWTWAGAESECRKKDCHLASIHSREEERFLGKLVEHEPDKDNLQCNNIPDHFAWIGLHTNNGLRQWSDGTADDYYSQQSGPSRYFGICAIPPITETTLLTIGVGSRNGEHEVGRFICKKSTAT
ncbi:unnamed protein product, partial [Mesorhabditis belari]|uniref:C-type lectin domain-containing protein n=1 Tax=Mesorhabditis belari TaxID=2138241 RepID=A0AAF3ELW5_9BILA